MVGNVKDLQIDRSSFSVTTEHEKAIVYWRDKTPEERWQGVEALRQMMYGYDPIADRVQRILEIVKSPWAGRAHSTPPRGTSRVASKDVAAPHKPPNEVKTRSVERVHAVPISSAAAASSTLRSDFVLPRSFSCS